MLYRCRSCGQEVAMGVLPSSTTGLLFVPVFGALCAVAVVYGSEVGGWVWLAWIPASIVVSLVLAAVLRALEFSVVCWRSCPRCDRKTWTSGARDSDRLLAP